MTTPAEIKAGADAAQAFILKKIRSEVPSMFEGKAEEAIPQHRQDIVDLATAVLGAAQSVRSPAS